MPYVYQIIELSVRCEARRQRATARSISIKEVGLAVGSRGYGLPSRRLDGSREIAMLNWPHCGP